MSEYLPRPQTPQAMLHRLPDKPDEEQLSLQRTSKPAKYIILIIASTAVAGKVQIAKSVAAALACPLFQGDSLHETAAKAAGLGAEPNEAPYQRMWLSKMTRTGLLFPEESRPATEGFSGFGGASSSSASMSRRNSGSSASYASSVASSLGSTGLPPAAVGYINKPPAPALTETGRLRKENPALMVVTHPTLEQWHKDSIRKAVGEYGIGVVFVPLDDIGPDELPVLNPLDPRTMANFSSLVSFASTMRAAPSLDNEVVLQVNVEAKVEDHIKDIVAGVGEIISQ